MDIRERNFQVGLVGKIISELKSGFSSIVLNLNGLLGRTLSVKITNFPKEKDYSAKIEDLKRDLSKLPGLLDKISSKEYPTFDPLVAAMGKVEASIKQLKFPEPKEITFKTIVDALSQVNDSIKSIEIPSTEKTDVSGLLHKLDILNESIKNIKIPQNKQEKVDFKQVVDAIDSLKSSMPVYKSEKTAKLDIKPITDLLIELKTAIKELSLQEKIEFPESIEVSNFPVQKTPQPVTNININPLRGLVHSTTTTVTSSLQAIPGYGVLDNRKSMILFNNSTDTTVYIGGSDVTYLNGLPIEPKSFSPPFDSGPRQIWYAVTQTGTADVRCIEVANDSGF